MQPRPSKVASMFNRGYIPVDGLASSMGLALWLVSSQADTNEVYRNLIRKLSLAGNTGRSSVPFLPHATLISELSSADQEEEHRLWKIALEALRSWKAQGKLAGEDSRAVTVDLLGVSTAGSYFQCIFVALQKTPALCAMNNLLVDATNSQASRPYMPHVSLLYSDLDAVQAQAVIDHLELSGEFHRNPQFSMQGIKAITFDTIELWNCNGPVEEWARLRSLPIAEV